MAEYSQNRLKERQNDRFIYWSWRHTVKLTKSIIKKITMSKHSGMVKNETVKKLE